MNEEVVEVVVGAGDSGDGRGAGFAEARRGGKVLTRQCFPPRLPLRAPGRRWTCRGHRQRRRPP